MGGNMGFEISGLQDFSDLGTGMLSNEHRLRTLDCNTFKWGMSALHRAFGYGEYLVANKSSSE